MQHSNLNKVHFSSLAARVISVLQLSGSRVFIKLLSSQYFILGSYVAQQKSNFPKNYLTLYLTKRCIKCYLECVQSSFSHYFLYMCSKIGRSQPCVAYKRNCVYSLVLSDFQPPPSFSLLIIVTKVRSINGWSSQIDRYQGVIF